MLIHLLAAEHLLQVIRVQHLLVGKCLHFHFYLRQNVLFRIRKRPSISSGAGSPRFMSLSGDTSPSIRTAWMWRCGRTARPIAASYPSLVAIHHVVPPASFTP